MSDDELGQQRGGFVWAGMTINLGAEIRSYVDGRLVVQTNLVWGDTGASVQRTVFAAGPDAAAADSGVGLLAAAGLQPGAADGAVTFANVGRTAFIQAIGNSVQSIVLNAANGTDLRQQTDVTVNITNFASVHRAAVASLIGLSLADLGRR